MIKDLSIESAGLSCNAEKIKLMLMTGEDMSQNLTTDVLIR